MGTILALVLLSAAPARASVTTEEAVASERLTAQANEFLLSMLGPGRGKAIVSVEGEETHSSTQDEYSVPAPPKPAAAAAAAAAAKPAPKEMPGYNKEQDRKEVEREVEKAKEKEAERPPEIMRKSSQSSTWESGFEIKQMRVSVVLDSRLAPDQIAAVTDFLPKFLHVDPSRGDEMTIVRADFRVVDWKSAATSYLESLEGLRTSALWAGILLVILLIGLLIYFTTTGAIKTFMGELAAYQAAPAEKALEAEAEGEETEGAEPELLPGGMPSLSDEGEPAAAGGAPAAGEGPMPMLGHRFDFLTAHKPADLAHLIGGEPPEDLALLFATLSASHPDLSAAVFAAFDPNARASVSRALAGMTIVDPERLEALESRLKNLVDFGVRGPQRLGTILSRLPLDERDLLFRDVVASNPKVAEELEQSLFSFEDVVSLKDADFRRLIIAVPYAVWGLALRGSPENVVNRVLSELDEGTQSILKEGMASPQPRMKIMEARSKVISQTLLMSSKGEIVLQRDASRELI